MAQHRPIPGDAPEAVQALATQLRDAKEAAAAREMVAVEKWAFLASWATERPARPSLPQPPPSQASQNSLSALQACP